MRGQEHEGQDNYFCTTDNLRGHTDIRARGRYRNFLPTPATLKETDNGELYRRSVRGVID
jgi:hypothetical protein